MASSKTRNHHTHDIIYNLCKSNIFQNKKEIKFISITDPSFINYAAKLGNCMEPIDASLNAYHISTLKKKLDKAEQNIFVVTVVTSGTTSTCNREN